MAENYGRPVAMPQVGDGGNPYQRPIPLKPQGGPNASAAAQKIPAGKVTRQERAAVRQTRKRF